MRNRKLGRWAVRLTTAGALGLGALAPGGLVVVAANAASPVVGQQVVSQSATSLTQADFVW